MKKKLEIKLLTKKRLGLDYMSLNLFLQIQNDPLLTEEPNKRCEQARLNLKNNLSQSKNYQTFPEDFH